MDKKVETTFEEIKDILKNVSEKQDQLTEKQDRLTESQDRLTKSQDRLTESQVETDRQLKDTATQMKETGTQMKETDKRLKKLDELFTGQWGKLMESLVKGDLIKLLNSRNVEVKAISKEHERELDNKPYEVDIIAINGLEIVAVEVKTTLRLENVKFFTEKLKHFKNAFTEYKDKKIYGAVAYLKANEGSDKYAERQGLFVIRATGSSSSITNEKDFKPKVF